MVKNRDVLDEVWPDGELSQDIIAVSGENGTVVKSKKKPSKKFEDYAELIRAKYAPKRCLLSGKLKTWDEREGRWVSVRNKMGSFRSFCRDNAGEGWNASACEDHFDAYEDAAPLESLVETVSWDKVDRVKKLANALVVKNFEPEEVEELIKDFGTKMMRRLDNPNVRNRILVLKGPQEIGKDWWLDALIGGFARAGYVKELAIANDREALRMLHSAAVFRITEFDRTSRMEVSLLKRILTAPSSDERLPYEAESETRTVRASFVATANVDDILRDTTGGTRFIILDVVKIAFDYPGHNDDKEREAHRLQVLAQFKFLADIGFKSSAKTEQSNKDYIEYKTPLDPELEVVDRFRRYAKERCAANMRHGCLLKTDADPAILAVSLEERMTPRGVTGLLRRHEIEGRSKLNRWWIVDTERYMEFMRDTKNGVTDPFGDTKI